MELRELKVQLRLKVVDRRAEAEAVAVAKVEAEVDQWQVLQDHGQGVRKILRPEVLRITTQGLLRVTAAQNRDRSARQQLIVRKNDKMTQIEENPSPTHSDPIIIIYIQLPLF